jgi:hypothetical protein
MSNLDKHIGPELARILDCTDFEYGGMRLISCEIIDEDNSTIVEFWDDLADIPRQRWKIICRHVKEFVFRNGNCVGIEVSEAHPLLIKHNEPSARLYFKGCTNHHKALLADLYEFHRGLVGPWLQVEDFVNQMPGPPDLFCYGLFADGPQSLLKGYADILKKYGISTSWIDGSPPKYWRDGSWQEASRENIVLFVNDSYVVAEAIECRRVEADIDRASPRMLM